jgi:hypothetical protein
VNPPLRHQLVQFRFSKKSFREGAMAIETVIIIAGLLYLIKIFN